MKSRHWMSDMMVMVQEYAIELHYVLDDDQSDKLDEFVMIIAEEFEFEDTGWIREKIQEYY